MSNHKVIVTDHDFESLSVEREILEDIAKVEEYTANSGNPNVDHNDLNNVDGVLNLRNTIGADQIAALENCKVISRYGIGVDNIDIEAATDAEIPVTNVPDYCLEEVATHATALGLNLLRGIKPYDTSVADGNWSRHVCGKSHRLSELTAGIVGYGAIGREVSKRLAAFGLDIVVSDPFLETSDLKEGPASLVSFEELISRARLVTIHSPLTPDTRNLFGIHEFENMHDEAVLVNVARGPIVDDDALSVALEEEMISGAALDVFPKEPPTLEHQLRDHPQVITTPHVAWYSEESNTERRRKAANIIRAALEGKHIENVVNKVE